MEPDTLLTAKEIAELLDVHPGTITSYHSRGQMPVPDATYGRTNLWKRSTVDAWRAGVTRDRPPR
jgi:hypothetical protein